MCVCVCVCASAVVVSGCDGNAEWSCFWDMEIDLRIAAFFEWDAVDLNEAQQLRFLEEHIEFK